jgi:hypothetical protein
VPAKSGTVCPISIRSEFIVWMRLVLSATAIAGVLSALDTLPAARSAHWRRPSRISPCKCRFAKPWNP